MPDRTAATPFVPTLKADTRSGRHRPTVERVGVVASVDARVTAQVRDVDAHRGLYVHEARHNAEYVR